jgi:transposase
MTLVGFCRKRRWQANLRQCCSAAAPQLQLQADGAEARPLSQWLFSALAEAGLPVIWVETRHMRGGVAGTGRKTDRNDARSIAQMMRAGLYRSVHVKTLRSQKLRMLLTQAAAAQGDRHR